MKANTEILGVVGGMGPAATIQFMHLVVSLTPAQRDQDHIRMLVDMNRLSPIAQRRSWARGRRRYQSWLNQRAY